MSLPVKRRNYRYSVHDHKSGKWIKVNSAYAVVRNSGLDQLEACLLNAQRTVQAFRVLLQEARDANDNNYFDYLHESDKLLSATLALHYAERERDNARAALEECRKLNVTLREELAITLAGADADAFTIGVLNTKLSAMTAERDSAYIKWNAAESEMWTGELRERIETLTEQRDRAMFYARHRARDCAQMENADCECTCGLTELRNKVKEETK